MSYILDALKRADAERGRGAVPGLHTRQLANPSENEPAAPGARNALWLGLAGALTLAGVAGGLWLWNRPAQPPVALVMQPVTLQPQASPALTVPAPRAPAESAPIAPVRAAPVVSAPIKAEPEPTSAAPATPAAATASPEPAPPRVTAKSAPAAPALAAPASDPAAAVPLLSELPDELRRQVPTITITGAVYAANPAQRLLLVNNLVLAQGALVAPDLKLEEIQPRSSVFSLRGTRFRVAH